MTNTYSRLGERKAEVGEQGSELAPGESVWEPSREVPVLGEYDVCVLGGSCTGVFAAVCAARAGCSVALVERMGSFGGVATLSMVNVWHSPLDERFEFPIFAGLGPELMERLKMRGAVGEHPNSPHFAWSFHPAEMQLELDRLVLEHGIEPWLHTAFAAPHVVDGRLRGVYVENKSGRGILRARFFIDATGDGDLCHRLGLPTERAAHRQPSTTCALFSGWEALRDTDWTGWLREDGPAHGLPEGFVWGSFLPGSEMYMLAGTRVHEDCSDGAGLTRAEMEGRRQVGAMRDILRARLGDQAPVLAALPARIGIRETRHVHCLHRLTGGEVLGGKRFDDAIANGSYRVDIHHDDKPGITLRYLDGREVYQRPGHKAVHSRWREESSDAPRFYQIPYRCLVPQGPYGNLLAAGRFIDADGLAHAAIRVMVNMNQTGEAAGTAAALCLKHGVDAAALDPQRLRAYMAAYGSIML